ncbi:MULTISPECIES: glycosyltransferase family 2 protein [Frankia]|uniref:Glycosyl transferase n=1 Tax=Frankia alni (strain DSM 45986 / CECT 9034 / ACN14a) TaxID=326424 RepID=Q0RP36_FRAAA|nr:MULTISPECIES: glycosyltransferase family 2 protein [Frankia]CAJ60698.1 Putative glycosyl transferase [Frankia alni ACN14a]
MIARSQPLTADSRGPAPPARDGSGWPVPYDTARQDAAAGVDRAGVDRAAGEHSVGPVPAPGSVPVTAIILARDEAPNIVRAVRSVGWCAQVVVVDSGSTDGTVELARRAGATVWHIPWQGYAGQRQRAMMSPEVSHDWVFFLDSDEWVSTELATEIARRLGTEDSAAFSQRRRLVFDGRWIAHSGWYANSWQARLLDRRAASFDASVSYGERAIVAGPVARLAADLIDEDRKGLAAWLHKHVRYAELEAQRRAAQPALRERISRIRSEIRHPGGSTRPLGRTVAKEVVLPLVPAKPAALFCYMYLLRAGWRDGRQGLLFCLYYAWYELTVGALGRTGTPGSTSSTSSTGASGRDSAAAQAAPGARRAAPVPPQRTLPARPVGPAGAARGPVGA